METIIFKNYKDGIVTAIDEFNSVSFCKDSTRIYLTDMEESTDKRHIVGRIFSHSTGHISKIYLDTKRDIKSIKDVKIWDGYKDIWVKEVICDFIYPFGNMVRVGTKKKVESKTLLEEELFGVNTDIVKVVYLVSI